MYICYRLIKIFTFCFRSIYIIFARHYLEIVSESLLRFFKYLSFQWIWVYGLSSFPIVLDPSFKKIVFSYTVAWSFVNVSELVLVLWCSWSFIKEFFILSMVKPIIFRIGYMGSIIPWGHSPASRLVYSFLKSIHFYFIPN